MNLPEELDNKNYIHAHLKLEIQKSLNSSRGKYTIYDNSYNETSWKKKGNFQNKDI